MPESSRRRHPCLQVVVPVIYCVLCIPIVAHSQTQVTLGASKDNTLYQTNDGSLSNGAGMHMFVGVSNAPAIVRRSLIAFAFGERIPINATITSAVLTLHLSKTPTVAGTQSIELHRVLSNWGEGSSHASGDEGMGAASTTGDATWLHTSFSTGLWTTAGGDFSATVSASQPVGDPGFYSWGSTAQMVNDVQGWLVSPGTNFGWLLRAASESGNSTAKRFDTHQDTTVAFQPALTITYTIPSGVDEVPNVPAAFALSQNYPNPFNPATTIRFSLARAGHTTLKIFDMLGNEIATLMSEEHPAGKFQVFWKPQNISSGAYIYRLTSGDFIGSKMLLFLK